MILSSCISRKLLRESTFSFLTLQIYIMKTLSQCFYQAEPRLEVGFYSFSSNQIYNIHPPNCTFILSFSNFIFPLTPNFFIFINSIYPSITFSPYLQASLIILTLFFQSKVYSALYFHLKNV